MQYYFEPLEIPGKKTPSFFQNQFEYLFFYLEPDLKLASKKKYPQEFIDYLEENFKISLETTDYHQGKKNYWFFNEQKKQIFNKIEIFELLKDLKLWEHDIFVASAERELKSGNYLIKTPFGFSGRGVFEQGTRRKIDFPVLVEQKLQRVKDFSYFKSGNDFIFYENFIGKRFNYLGTTFQKAHLANFDSWFLANRVSSKEILFFKEKVENLNSFLKANQIEEYNVDCFLHLFENEVKIHIACEINLRKTMGYLFYQVYRRYYWKFDEMAFRLSKIPPEIQTKSLGPLENEEFYIHIKPA